MDANVTSIDGGGQRSNIVYTKTDGSLWCLGSNEHGEFGNGTYINSNDPIQVVDSNVVSAASGGSHTLLPKRMAPSGRWVQTHLASLEPELLPILLDLSRYCPIV